MKTFRCINFESLKYRIDYEMDFIEKHIRRCEKCGGKMASYFVKSVKKIIDQDTKELIFPTSPLGQSLIEELNEIIFCESSFCPACNADGKNEDKDIEAEVLSRLYDDFGEEVLDWGI